MEKTDAVVSMRASGKKGRQSSLSSRRQKTLGLEKRPLKGTSPTGGITIPVVTWESPAACSFNMFGLVEVEVQLLKSFH